MAEDERLKQAREFAELVILREAVPTFSMWLTLQSAARLLLQGLDSTAPIDTDPVGRPGHTQGDQQWPDSDGAAR